MSGLVPGVRVANIYKYREIRGAYEARSNGIRYVCPHCGKLFWADAAIGDALEKALPPIVIASEHWSATLKDGVWTWEEGEPS